ncbi:MAG: hypothetical protein FWG38_09710 [Defluviitaleaceae bacterium]|nr:hypothetical protein [Defluviitaleaceae bacterium]
MRVKKWQIAVALTPVVLAMIWFISEWPRIMARACSRCVATGHPLRCSDAAEIVFGFIILVFPFAMFVSCGIFLGFWLYARRKEKDAE